MNKLNKEQIREMRELYSKGGATQISLAKRYKVSQDTIRYHLFEEYKTKKVKYYREKYRNMSKEEKQILYNKYKEYYRSYMNNRYSNDLVFREKQKMRAKSYNRMKR